jgi:hypothetical protein
MNELIAKLYDQALVLESNGDYVAGELDPVKFAELVVKEVLAVQEKLIADGHNAWHLHSPTKEHFGVE